MSRKCVHSRAWHGAFILAIKEGHGKAGAKDIAKVAAGKATMRLAEANDVD